MFYDGIGMQNYISSLDDFEILEEFSKSENPEFRFDCALNLKAPVEIILKLCSDRDRLVRQKAAMNPKLTGDKIRLLYLSNPVDEYVVSGLARNENCPVEMQEELSTHSHYLVRENLAYNKKCLPRLKAILCSDENSLVQGAANHNPIDSN